MISSWTKHLPLVTICLMHGTLQATPTSANGYNVHLVDPPVTNHVILTEEPLPPVCKPLQNVHLHGCRGQRLPLSFVVTTAQTLDRVQVTGAPLRNNELQWNPDSIDIRVVKDYYRNTIFSHMAVMPSVLVHDDSFLAIEPAPTEKDPDRLANVAKGPLRDSDRLQPVDISSRRQFWVTIHIPDMAQAGQYYTTITITPANAEPTNFQLTVDVYPFDLLPPMLEYSIYYPAYLETGLPQTPEPWDGDARMQFGDLTAEQMLAEFRNMVAHGLTNPNIYQPPKVLPDGSLDFTKLDRVLDLREKAGMRPKHLYLLSHSVPVIYKPLNEEQVELVRSRCAAINTWVRGRGYEKVFLATHDEAWGENLSNERPSMLAIEEAGGATFAAVMHPTFFDRVGDALTRPVLMSGTITRLNRKRDTYSTLDGLRHMDEIATAGSFAYMLDQPRYRQAIDGIHRQGRKIFTYMNPMAGFPLPEMHRRNTGLGLWRVGFDGTMTWAYTHIYSAGMHNQPLVFAMVLRTEKDPIDTLHYEGFREGVYDVQYLTTLQARLSEATGRFPDDPLVDDTLNWLKTVDIVEGDLDAIRHSMATRIIALQNLGYRERSLEELFAGKDRDEIRMTSMPEPWKFKPDPNLRGVQEKWFALHIDDSDWIDIRTDQNEGWNPGHYGPENVGEGWYRGVLPVTSEDLAKKHKYLFVGASDEDSWVYLNGSLIFEHSFKTTGLIPYEIWMTSYTVDLSDVELNEPNTLIVRVKNVDGMGGIWKPVQFITSDQSLSYQQIQALVKKRKPGATP